VVEIVVILRKMDFRGEIIKFQPQRRYKRLLDWCAARLLSVQNQENKGSCVDVFILLKS